MINSRNSTKYSSDTRWSTSFDRLPYHSRNEFPSKRIESPLRFLVTVSLWCESLRPVQVQRRGREKNKRERKKKRKRERKKKIQSGNSLFQVECDRSRHLQREEYESEELCNAVALRNILVLWRRIRVLSETPQRYVTYVHSLISSFTFIHRLESWIYVERHSLGMLRTVKHFPYIRISRSPWNYSSFID